MTAAGAAMAFGGCVGRQAVSQSGLPTAFWSAIRNPVYAEPQWSTKDCCMIEKDGVFYLFFSAFYFTRGQGRSHVTGVWTRDFKTFSEPMFMWDGQEDGWIGMCSPDIVQLGDRYILTYNSWGDKKDQPNQLFYAVSTDLKEWRRDISLAHDLTAGKRAIDAAIAFDGQRYVLIYKEGRSPGIPRVAWSASLDGPWAFVGDGHPKFTRLDKDFPAKTQENYQFLNIDGQWRMVTTDYAPHLMHIYRMDGDGRELTDWLRWTDGQPLHFPEESFNTDHNANAGAIADWRHLDGYFYCLYAGRTEGITHARRGDNKLAIARSRDLKTWYVPPF